MKSGIAEAKGRPKRTYTTGPVTQLLRWLVIASTLVLTIWVIVRYPSLPAKIPTHFNLMGEPDGWGPRSSIIWMVALFVAMIAGVEALSHFPRAFNYVGTITEHNAQEMYRTGEQMLVWLNVTLVLMYASLILSVLQVASGMWLLMLSVAAMVVVIAVGIGKMIRAGRQ